MQAAEGIHKIAQEEQIDEENVIFNTPEVKAAEEPNLQKSDVVQGDADLEATNYGNNNRHAAVTDVTNNDDADNVNTDENGITVEAVTVNTIPTKKKKKKKKKKKGAEGADDLEFFELGQKEADEDLLYDPSRPITHRIETAVQRYKKNRKFSSTRSQVFSSYLRFGGISTGQKSFLGQDGFDNEDADAEEITMRRATDFIEEKDDDDMEVDFTYTVRVYLSSYLIDKSGYVQMDQFREGPQVIISFLNYLIKHEVCPEYMDDIQGALNIAQQAKEELPNCKKFAQLAPGKFNKACSLTFGGELYGMFDDPWGGEENVAKMIGISPKDANDIIKKVFGSDDISELRLVPEASKIALLVEIIDIDPHIDNSAITNDDKNLLDEAYLRKIHVRPYQTPDVEPFSIALGLDVAKFPIRGMLVTADFYLLSNGWWYCDRVTNVYPSYYLDCENSSDDDE